MNHHLVEKALCGTYTQLSEVSGYVESSLTTLEDGTLLGAYIVEAGDGEYLITDDGDTTFRAAAAGAEITSARFKRYKELAHQNGVTMADGGVLSAKCSAATLPFVLATFLGTAGEIASLSVKHRPRDKERFEAVVGRALISIYGEKVIKRLKITGLSGHQISFPFGVPVSDDRTAVIQPIPASDGKIIWPSVYEAGGKFKDVRGARDNLRLVAVLEDSEGVDRARRYFADAADVIVYSGGELALAA